MWTRKVERWQKQEKSQTPLPATKPETLTKLKPELNWKPQEARLKLCHGITGTGDVTSWIVEQFYPFCLHFATQALSKLLIVLCYTQWKDEKVLSGTLWLRGAVAWPLAEIQLVVVWDHFSTWRKEKCRQSDWFNLQGLISAQLLIFSCIMCFESPFHFTDKYYVLVEWAALLNPVFVYWKHPKAHGTLVRAYIQMFSCGSNPAVNGWLLDLITV